MNLPNKITTFRMICVIFVVAFLLLPINWMVVPYLNIGVNYLIAWIIFLVASISDMVDGKIARKYNLITDYGKLMDPIADKMLVNSALIILSVVGPIRIPVICTVIMVARDIVVDAIRMNAVKKNKVIAANIFGKLKTVFQMVALIFVMINDFGLSDLLTLPNYLKIGQILIYLATAMSFISGVIYVYQNRDLFREMK